MDEQTKACGKCRVDKPYSSFSKDATTPTGLKSYCKQCSSECGKANRKKNAEREVVKTPEYKKCPGCSTEKQASEFNKSKTSSTGLTSYCSACNVIHHREQKYGVSEEWYQATLKAQGGACAICKHIPQPGDKGLCLDHDHVTGEPRGLPCFHCNLLLGYAKDSAYILQNAIEYLNKYK